METRASRQRKAAANTVAADKEPASKKNAAKAKDAEDDQVDAAPPARRSTRKAVPDKEPASRKRKAATDSVADANAPATKKNAAKAKDAEDDEVDAAPPARRSTRKVAVDKDLVTQKIAVQDNKTDDDEADADAPKPKRKAAATKATAAKKKTVKTKAAEDGEAATDKVKATPKAAVKSEAADIDDDTAPPTEPKIVKAIKKNGAVVDEYCPIAAKCHVYDGWDCMLNQTEISANNNKFYVIQLLKDDSADQFHVWTRWGRVGVKGQSKLEACTLDKGMKLFKSKFWDKTKNLWEDRENFEKIPGKYFLLEREFGDDDGDTAKGLDSAPPKSVKIPDSQLEEPVQELIKLIFNMKMMTQTMVEIGYNADKMPLGKLTKANIQKGYNVLAEIADVLNTPTATSQSLLSDLSSKFYTIIPHEFGMRRPQIINTPQLLKQKIEMVEALGDIQIATTLLSHTAANHDKNPIDLQYESLKADLHHVDPSSETFKLVNTYLKNTHAATHSNYALEIEDVFTVGRHGEDERFNQLPNRQLLWHGSRLTNFVGILSQGLRIAPPEAPVTGYMFGKGIYLANMVSKSSNYCFATRNSSTGILLLCEAALGDQLKLKQADYNADQSCRQANCHSTWGVGQTRPDPEGAISDPKDPNVKVPSGKPVKTNEQGCNLLYDEFIVYSVEQVKIRYLLKTKFHFKY